MTAAAVKSVISFLMLFVLAGVSPSFADTFSASLPAGTSVTMGNYDYETLPFTITNNGPTKDIRNITFTIDTTLYTFNAGTVPPSGWCIKSLSAGSIEFALVQGGGGCGNGSTAAQISSGGSETFNINVTGPGSGPIPSAASDATDTLTNITVSSEGGFTLSGALPTWTRRSFAISLSASPSSAGVGDSIMVTMNVTNRSTTTKNLVAGNPDPPGRTYTGGASVTPIGVAVYGSTASTTNPSAISLSNNINASVTTINVSSTSGYPSSGRVLIDNELIDYTGKAAGSFTGCTRGVGGSTASSHDNGDVVYSQNTSSFSVASGESAIIKWFFSAGATGTVYFTSAANSGGTATSISTDSNVVVIGNFTAFVTVSPLNVISGQTVAVGMTVKNNGASTLTNISPSLTPGGTATKTISSGPSPAAPYGSLAAGESVTFVWNYVITGTVGQTFIFSGSATSSGPTTNTAASGTGAITQYSVAVDPTTIPTGLSSNRTLIWTVYNRGSEVVKDVRITIPAPLTSDCSASKGWGYVSNTLPANWTAATAGTPVNTVTFTANNPVGTYGIPVGGSQEFRITINCVPQVAADTAYNFQVDIVDKNGVQTSVNTTITVTAYSLVQTVFDDDCSSAGPGSKPADGDSRDCLRARLTSGGNPVPGTIVHFSITAGSGSFSDADGDVLTDAGGYATVYLISPCSATDVSTTVLAKYTDDTYDTDTVLFAGVGGSNLSYVGGSLSPQSGLVGDTPAFTLMLRNCGTSNLTIQTTSQLRFGTRYTPTLSGAVTINAGGSAMLTFVPVTIGSETVSYRYEPSTADCPPVLDVDAAGYSGIFSGGDDISDTVTINNGMVCPPTSIRILDWREVVR